MATSVVPARFPEDVATVRPLFLEYAEGLGFDLGFQGFEEELAGLPGDPRAVRCSWRGTPSGPWAA